MHSDEIRASLLEAINLLLGNSPESYRQADVLLKKMRKSLRFTTINYILWSPFFSELNDYEYIRSPEFLLKRQHDLMGLSRRYFHAYVGHDHLAESSNEESQFVAYLQAALDWLSSLNNPQLEDDEHFSEVKHTIGTYRSLYPVVDDVYDEQVVHFILKIVSEIVENIEVPSIAFTECGHLFAMPLCMIGERDEYDYPSLDRDFSWAKNALRALQGQSWISFRWQFLSTNVMLVVK